MEKVHEFLNKDKEFGKIPLPDDVIQKYVRLGNCAIYVLVLVATALFASTNGTYLGVLNAAVEFVAVSFLLLTELPFYNIPQELEAKIRSLAGFLYVPVGRLAFVIYLALILYGFSTFGVVIGVIFVVATLFNLFLYFKHPEAQKLYHDLENPAASYGSTEEQGNAKVAPVSV